MYTNIFFHIFFMYLSYGIGVRWKKNLNSPRSSCLTVDSNLSNDLITTFWCKRDLFFWPETFMCIHTRIYEYMFLEFDYFNYISRVWLQRSNRIREICIHIYMYVCTLCVRMYICMYMIREICIHIYLYEICIHTYM